MVSSMGAQRLRATFRTLQENTDLGDAIIIFFGALFLLSVFRFYPIFLLPVLALVCAVAGYKAPWAGTLLAMLFTFPAIAYQSPVLAWVFTLAISITLFEVFEHWKVISFLQIVIAAPFAPFPLSLLSGFLLLVMPLAALHLGSKKSLMLSIPAVYIILLLSTLWMTQNSAFLPILDPATHYGPAMPDLQNNAKPSVDFVRIFSASGSAIGSLIDFSNMRVVSPALGKIFENTIRLFVKDAAFLQLASWAVVLFLVGYVPGRVDNKFKQTIGACSIGIIVFMHFFIAAAYGTPLVPQIVAYAAFSIAAIAALEGAGVSITREKFLMRQEKTRKFDKFGAGDLTESEGAASLDDVGGYEDVKAELREAIITPIQQKEITYTYGIKPPTGILLFGPPGTGKTHLMRGLAKELGIGFYYVKCSGLLSEWYGESERNVSELFTIARKNAPCVVFFDELDSIGKRRDKYTSDDVAPRIMSVFLEELDGFKEKGQKPVIFIGATNIPDQLDPALLRPGRLDKIIYMHLPDPAAREAIFHVHTKKLPLAEDVDFAKLAKLTERYSGADIKNICTEASRLAAREALAKNQVMPVTMKHFTTILKGVRPSTSLEMLEEQEKFQLDFERRVGLVKADKEETEEIIRWKDVAGLDDVKKALLEAIEVPLLHQELIKKYKIKPAKGLLLYGPPGCGKTMIAKAAANELHATFLSISAADLMKGGYDGGVRAIKREFNRGREQSPAIIFIDEIEALASDRRSNDNRIVTQLLVEMDGIKELKGVMLIGATNRPSVIDPALMRPGRFDKIIYIPPPDEGGRSKLFELNLAPDRGMDGKKAYELDVEFDMLAKASRGFTGADIASICQEAKMNLVRGKIKGEEGHLEMIDILEIIKKRRPSVSEADLQEYERFTSEHGERK
jgi:SpoVK/Ycf46/Vps4 family AAA+-type ATPase